MEEALEGERSQNPSQESSQPLPHSLYPLKELRSICAMVNCEKGVVGGGGVLFSWEHNDITMQKCSEPLRLIKFVCIGEFVWLEERLRARLRPPWWMGEI